VAAIVSVSAAIARRPILAVLAVLWLLVVAGLVIVVPEALNAYTVTTVLQFSTILALVALGQSLVILCGGAGIDLSVGGVVSLTAVFAALAGKAGAPGWTLPTLCLLIGALLGALNGVLVTRVRILPLITTLGTFYVYSGLAVAITGGAATGSAPAWMIGWGRGQFGAIPLPFLTTAFPAFVIAAVLLGETSWGRWVYAMGFNEASARLCGVPVDRVRALVYILSGVCAGTAALVSLSWLGSARPNIGANLELTSLAAAMLGGIAIFGGRGGVVGVLAAVILLVTLQTGLLQLNVNATWQVGVVGVLLILVLLVDRFASHRA
jgi:ribose/xylose/arabinose/galactoside ABC-type transport system permease subunit